MWPCECMGIKGKREFLYSFIIISCSSSSSKYRDLLAQFSLWVDAMHQYIWFWEGPGLSWSVEDLVKQRNFTPRVSTRKLHIQLPLWRWGLHLLYSLVYCLALLSAWCVADAQEYLLKPMFWTTPSPTLMPYKLSLHYFIPGNVVIHATSLGF